jgi:hypothetical protein
MEFPKSELMLDVEAENPALWASFQAFAMARW